MKLSYTLILVLAAFAITNAQTIKMEPKWEVGQRETFELTKSKLDLESDTVSSRDSVHAIIKSEVTSQDIYKVHYTWMVLNYYEDTIGLSDKDKLSPKIVSAFANRCPIKFSIRKDDYSVTVENDNQIDSAESAVAEEMKADVKKKARKADKDGILDWGMAFLVSTAVEKQLLKLPSEFYKIYEMDSIVLGRPLESAVTENDLKKIGLRDAGSKGVATWEEEPKGVYHYKQHTVGSLGGLADMFAKLALSMDSNLADKKTRAATSDEAMKMLADREYSIDKYNSNVISYYYNTKMTGSMMGMRMNDKEWIRLRKIDED